MKSTPYVFMLVAPYQLKTLSRKGSVISGHDLSFQRRSPFNCWHAEHPSKKGFYTLRALQCTWNIWSRNRNILFVLNLSFVFVGMIALIALANVFKYVSTNTISATTCELAMLRSMTRMTDHEFNKMMVFAECIFYGFRSLVWGIPIAGLFFSWLIYQEWWRWSGSCLSISWSDYWSVRWALLIGNDRVLCCREKIKRKISLMFCGRFNRKIKIGTINTPDFWTLMVRIVEI